MFSMARQRRKPPLAGKVVVAYVLTCQVWSLHASSSPCDPSDPSANFSSSLSLPSVQALPWSKIRETIAEGQFQEAERSLKATHLSAAQQFWYGVLLLHERSTFASIRCLERAAHLGDTSQTETLLAADYFLLNQRLLAADALQRALRLQPADPMAHYLRGRLEFVSGSFDKAQQDFAAILAQEPNDYHSLYYLGVSEWRVGDSVAARKTLRRAVDVLVCHRLNFSLAPYTLAQIELDSGAATDALRHADLALTMARQPSINSRDADEVANALVLRGKIEDHLGRSMLAEQDLQQAVKLNPYLPEGWYLLSHVYRKIGDERQALSALKRFEQIQRQL
jgi:tetratricopeptide (TPR) repeat protein